jgi:hypothetical protein
MGSASNPMADGTKEHISLREFLEFAEKKAALTLDEHKLVVRNARRMIQGVYVHLQLKKAMHAVDPVQRLRLLESRLELLKEPMPDRKFHAEMLSIFSSLRDLHTRYLLPQPFQSHAAFVPFEIEEYFEDQDPARCRYVVTRVFESADSDPDFRVGVRVTHWNGIPIPRAIELNAERTAGSNSDARHARGLEGMTLRSLATTLPPDEEWVIVTYLDLQGQCREARFSWQVLPVLPTTPAVSPESKQADSLGLDLQGESVRQVRMQLFAKKVDRVRAATDAREGALQSLESESRQIMPGVMRFHTVAGGTFGYLRLFSFAPPAGVPAFVQEVVRILQLMPQKGLILDVRGNPGGDINAAERLLQLFTPRRIERARLYFVNSDLNLRITQASPRTTQWAPSIAQAIETGAEYSQGFPLSPDDEANAIGQQYCGPVVLITDARCYSATDIFAAGFEDHKIGTILGTSGATGAGGANFWDFDKVRFALPDVFSILPKGAAMKVAIRRATRVGENAGVPLEDLGVVTQPSNRYYMTRRDVLGEGGEPNQDLIARAIEILQSKQPAPFLSAELAGSELRLTSEQLDRVDVFLDGRPFLSANVNGKTATVSLKDAPGSFQHVRVQGYFKNTLIVSCAAAR